MYSPGFLTAVLTVGSTILDLAFGISPTRVEPIRNSTGLTDVVSWDNYTLWLKHQRVFIHSGEFHAFRLPIPDLWPDIFQKMKAAGLNAVSIYNHWGLSNPAPGVLDFDGYRSLQTLFDAAKVAGLWVIFRPGPYINAETTAGGIALWAISTVAGEIRTNATDYTEAWTPYIQAIAKSVASNQITEGGPIIAVEIDNEYYQYEESGAYFALLESTYRKEGVVIPFTYNDPGEGRNFINGTGAVDLYGMDSYPQGFDCSNPSIWNPVLDNYHSYHQEVNSWQPWYMPEFQAGAYDPWAGSGYDRCAVLTGPEFEDVFYKHNWASNVKLVSYYMIFGGTSWGGIPYPGVYTSYDYGSSITENRGLTSKYDEIKRQGLFLRSTPEFYKTDWIGNSSSGAVTLDNTKAFATYLLNPDTGSGFYIVRQADSTSMATLDYAITVTTSHGTLKLPRMFESLVINGRQSKIIATDYTWGSSKALYSTVSILFGGTIGSRDVLFLYGDADQCGEIALSLSGTWKIQTDDPRVTFIPNPNYTSITFAPGNSGLITVYESDNQLVLYSDPVTAATFWAPMIPSETNGDFDAYWQFGSNMTVLVGGPYLVRKATISASTLALVGDLNATVPLTLVTPSAVTSVTWNGVNVAVSPDGNSSLLIGQLTYGANAPSIAVPSLNAWRFADSLPELYPGFSDSDWVTATHTTTNLPAMWYGDGRVLYGCDYGYCENTIIWRGHFDATGSETFANLSINGGDSFAASVWINGRFINTTSGGPGVDETDQIYTFPDNSVAIGEDNVITVVLDHMGTDESSSANPDICKSPRGIRGFKLNHGNFSTWKVQGKLGGYTDYPDRVRGVLNEGGTYGERQGWHLPGFDTSSWENRLLSEGLPESAPGIGFFVTTFDLAIPTGLDVPISFVFDHGRNDQPYRAVLYVNGWNMGKRIANLGPQTKFPVHQGILDYNGRNTVALILWATENKAISPSLELVVDSVIEGGVGPIATNNPGWCS